MSLHNSSYTHKRSENDLEQGRNSDEDDNVQLPALIHFLIKWSLVARPLNAVLFLLFWAIWNVFTIFPLFAAITDSAVTGITIAALGLVSGAMNFTQINFAKRHSDSSIERVKARLLAENAQQLVSILKGGAIFSIFLFNCLIIPVTYFLLIFPKFGAGGSLHYILKEKASWMLWVGFIATEMGMLLSMPLVALQDPMAQIIQKTWTRNLKAYMKKVHSILIDLSISADASEARAIAEIAAEQRNIESWATAVNYLNSTQQGLAVAIRWDLQESGPFPFLRELLH